MVLTCIRSRFLCTALIALLPGLCAAADDGPLRGLLRERLAERAGQDVTPQPARQLAAGQKIPGAGRYEIHLRHGGRDRMALLHVPANRDPTAPAALVMALHGGGGGAIHQADDANYGLISKAEQAGFI